MNKVVKYLTDLTGNEDLLQSIATLCGVGAITLALIVVSPILIPLVLVGIAGFHLFKILKKTLPR